MSPVLVQTVEAQLALTVAEELVEQNLGYLPWLLGENLAGQVDAWVMEQGLGYYPALDFFRDKPTVVDPALLSLMDQVAMFCADYSQRELDRRLRRLFSRVSIPHVQCLAYTMPRVRHSRNAAPDELARHYAPNRLRLTIHMSSIQKQTFDGLVPLSLDKLSRATHEVFANFHIEAARLLPVISRPQ